MLASFNDRGRYFTRAECRAGQFESLSQSLSESVSKKLEEIPSIAIALLARFARRDAPSPGCGRCRIRFHDSSSTRSPAERGFPIAIAIKTQTSVGAQKVNIIALSCVIPNESSR